MQRNGALSRNPVIAVFLASVCSGLKLLLRPPPFYGFRASENDCLSWSKGPRFGPKVTGRHSQHMHPPPQSLSGSSRSGCWGESGHVLSADLRRIRGQLGTTRRSRSANSTNTPNFRHDFNKMQVSLGSLIAFNCPSNDLFIWNYALDSVHQRGCFYQSSRQMWVL